MATIGSPHSSSRPLHSHLHRRLTSRMGSPHGQPHSKWDLAHEPNTPSHNVARTRGSAKSPLRVSQPHPEGSNSYSSDNRTVVALLNNQGGTHAPLRSIRADEIILWAYNKGLTLEARHIAGSANIMADLLSRPEKIIQTEWTLKHQALTQIWALWDKPILDLFATKFSARLPYMFPQCRTLKPSTSMPWGCRGRASKCTPSHPGRFSREW